MSWLGRIMPLGAVLLASAAVETSRETPLGPQPTDPPPELAQRLALVLFATGLDRPVHLVTAPGDESGRLFVVELGGRVLVHRAGRVAPHPFADLSSRVAQDHRAQGLLSLAFHPRYPENGRLFVKLTAAGSGAIEILELRVKPDDPDRVDPDWSRLVLRIPKSEPFHNGGDLHFGRDGKLYTGIGDGGGFVAAASSRKEGSLFGKLLRIDVDAPEAKVEVVQEGLRNPWRFSFDRETGDLYIGDSGETRWEVIRILAADDIDGHDFGWPMYHGGHCMNRPGCDAIEVTLPTLEYTHDVGCSVTGGAVYRGSAIAELRGACVYADWCTALLRSLRWSKAGIRDHWEWRPTLDPESRLATIVAIAEDHAGELYLVSLDGVIWKLVPRPGTGSTPTPSP